ncbi:MAG: hypothetical protein AABY22_11535 [Nanoarchaeota archaeon]
MDIEKILKLLNSHSWEDKYLAVSILDKLGEEEFWEIVKNNFNNEYKHSKTDFVFESLKIDWSDALPWRLTYIEGKNACYLLNSDQRVVIDRYDTRQDKLNKRYRTIEDWNEN